MATVIIPPVLNGAGDLVPAILDVRLILADGSSALGFVSTDLVTEYQNTTIPDEGVELTLTPQVDIATEDGSATYYAISIRTQHKEQTFHIQVEDVETDQDLLDLVGATAMDGDNLIGGRLLTVDERAAMDAANAPSATNAIATMDDFPALLGTAAYEDVATFALSQINADIYDPTGFLDPASIDVAYDITERTITLTGTLSYYWRGEKKSLTSPWTSDPHGTGDGSFYLYSTDGDAFAWSSDPWSFDLIQVALAKVQQSGAVKVGFREIHGVMPFSTHQVLHSTVGAFRKSGATLDPATYTENTASDAATTPGFLSGVIVDEDLETTIPEWAQGTYTTCYIGASSVATFSTVATFPFRSSGSYLLVNNPTAGTEAAAVNNRYLNVYQILFPATSDADSQKYRTVMLQPQAQYTSLTAAQAEDPRNLVLGTLASLSPELVIHARITYVTAADDGNTGKCRIATGGVTYLAGGKASQVSVAGYTTPIAANIAVAFTPSNYTPDSADVESHLAAIDTALGLLA